MDLTYDDAQVVQRILIGMKADEVWVFGSRARGDFHSDSDLDLLVLIPDYNEARHIRSRHARGIVADISRTMDICVGSCLV